MGGGRRGFWLSFVECTGISFSVCRKGEEKDWGGDDMGGGNGMKSKTKRERNQAKDVNKGNTSQLAKNREAMNIICKVCRQVRFLA